MRYCLGSAPTHATWLLRRRGNGAEYCHCSIVDPLVCACAYALKWRYGPVLAGTVVIRHPTQHFARAHAHGQQRHSQTSQTVAMI